MPRSDGVSVPNAIETTGLSRISSRRYGREPRLDEVRIEGEGLADAPIAHDLEAHVIDERRPRRQRREERCHRRIVSAAIHHDELEQRREVLME